MPGQTTYDYAVIRVVPRIEREEFINVGVVLYCRTRRFLAAAVEFDADRLRALDPDVDVEVVREQIELIPRICAGDGPVGALGQADAFHWIAAPHSTMIQTSPVHSGFCDDPQAALDALKTQYLQRNRTQ